VPYSAHAAHGYVEAICAHHHDGDDVGRGLLLRRRALVKQRRTNGGADLLVSERASCDVGEGTRTGKEGNVAPRARMQDS
jgi:hypothetical protein